MNASPAVDKSATTRIVDACLNRSTEALRVIEDVARFALDDAWLATLAKDLRHEMALAVHQAFPAESLLAVRDTVHDVGTQVQRADEYQRSTLSHVLASNFKRAQQAIRSLEECGKLAAPDMSVCLEQLRYRVYTLEQNFGTWLYGQQALASIRICVLVDGECNSDTFRRRLDRLAPAGRIMLQLRDTQLCDRELLSRAQQLVEAARGRQVVAIVNNRTDIAAVAGADGVHLGQDDLPVRSARRLLGPQSIIGVSAHSLEQARQAVRDGANYIGIGPLFPSKTKQFESWIGVDTMREVVRELTIPSFAIGGLTLDNVGQVVAAGARHIAVQHAIWSAEDPYQALAAFQSAMPQESAA